MSQFFNSSLEEEILAMVEVANWLNKHEDEFFIPNHYKKYMSNLIKRLTQKEEYND